MRKIHWGEAVVPIIFALYCFAYLWQVYGFPYASVVYPCFLIFFIILFLIFIVSKQVLRHAANEGFDSSKETVGEELEEHKTHVQMLLTSWKKLYKPASVMIATFAYPYVVIILGFTITTSIFLLILFWIFGTRHIFSLLALSLGLSLFLFFALTFYLKLTLPPFALSELPLGF